MSKEKNKVADFVGTTDKKQEKEVKKAKKDKKPGFFKRLGGKFKDIFSELRLAPMTTSAMTRASGPPCMPGQKR